VKQWESSLKSGEAIGMRGTASGRSVGQCISCTVGSSYCVVDTRDAYIGEANPNPRLQLKDLALISPTQDGEIDSPPLAHSPSFPPGCPPLLPSIPARPPPPSARRRNQTPCSLESRIRLGCSMPASQLSGAPSSRVRGPSRHMVCLCSSAIPQERR